MALKPQKDIVVSWSVNPDEVIASAESGTPPLAKRLDAASACAAHGYRIGFHFDPMIYCDGWEEKYRLTVERLASAVPPEKVAWISVGTIRFNPALKKDIESRFPQNTILDGELLTDFDGKMRYPEHLRVAMYRKMYGFLKKHFGASALYLCMAAASIHSKTGVRRDSTRKPFNSGGVRKILSFGVLSRAQSWVCLHEIKTGSVS